VGVRLRPLREDEFAEWRSRTLDWYAADLVAHAGMTEAEARTKAESDASAYPHSSADEGHWVFAVEDETTGDLVGSVWFAEREMRGTRTAWVYSVEIDKARRGRGYGQEILLAQATESAARP
jgi:RimJ/RimL family protein N-acetyltransferase